MRQFVEAVGRPRSRSAGPPINSPKWCYQVETEALRLFRSFGTTSWTDHLTEWQGTVESLKKRYPREREMNRVPLQLAEGKELYLTPGNHSRLIRAVVEEFAPPGLPQAAKSFMLVTPAKSGPYSILTHSNTWESPFKPDKMPDVIIYHAPRTNCS